MAKKAVHENTREAPDASLSERISAAFQDHFFVLDRLQSIEKKELGDEGALSAAERAIADCVQRADGVALSEGDASSLEKLRAVYDSAALNILTLPDVEASTPVRKADPVQKNRRDKKRAEREKRGPQAATKAEDPGYTEWAQSFAAIGEMLGGVLLEEGASAARAALSQIEPHLNAIQEWRKNNDSSVEGRGFDPNGNTVLVRVREDLAAARAEFERVRGIVDEWETEEKESARREEIGTRFSNRIDELEGRAHDVFEMPLGTVDEVVAARASLDDLKRAVDAHVKSWDAEVKPILQAMGQLLGDWNSLVQRQRALRTKFETGGEARQRWDTLNTMMAEASKERWEAELPEFEIGLTYVEMRVLDARLLQGQRRKEQFEGVRKMLLMLRESWDELRQFAPSLSREQIDAGMRTERAIFDGRVRGLEERTKEYLDSAETSRPARLDEVARLWRNTLVRTHQLWNPDTEIGVRGVFLDERYGPEEVKGDDPEFVALVSEQHREDFEKLANGDVFMALRRRGVQTKEQQAREEQAARDGLNPAIPQLSLDRLLEDDAYANFRYGKFWKSVRAANAFRMAFRPDSTVSDEDAQKYVRDVPAFRVALAALIEARARVTATEDILIGKSTEVQRLDGSRSVADVRDAYDTYALWRENEKKAFAAAINAEGWTIPRGQRKFKLREFFAGYRQLGPAVIRDVPKELRDVVRTWAIAERHVRMYGRYTQWLLDENPDIAREMGSTLPKEFVVPRPRKQTTPLSDAASDASESEEPERVFTAEEQKMLQVPIAEERQVDEDYAGEVLGAGAFSGDGGAMSFAGKDTGEDADAASVPEVIPVYSATSSASRTPEAAPVDGRREAAIRNEREVRRILFDNVFWNNDVNNGARAAKLGVLLRKIQRGDADQKMNDHNGLREDRIEDFLAVVREFTDVEDLKRRVAEIRAKYAEVASAPVAAEESTPVPDAAPSVSPVTTEPPLGEAPVMASEPAPSASVRPRRAPASAPVTPRETVPPPPRPDDGVPVSSVRSESVPPVRPDVAPVRESAPSAPLSVDRDPFARFFGGGAPAPEVRPTTRVEDSRPSRAETTPVAPIRTVARPEPREEPVAPGSVRAESRVKNPIQARVETPVEAPREIHAEDRVSSWSRSLRNTVGRIFGGAVAAPVVVEAPAARAESAPTPEMSRRAAGGVISVLGKLFGPQIFADVPRYLPESFGDQNARAVLQADILDAIGKNASAMKNAAGNPERIHAANLDAAARLNRAISTSTTRNGEPLPEAEKARLREAVGALTEKYSERTQENAVARSRELAGIVEQSVRVLEAPGRRGSPALRLLSKLPFGIGTNLAYGVGDFRKRFESAVSRGGDAGLVARVATVFRETWEEAMQGIRANDSLSDRVMNTAEAITMIGAAYGLSTVITGLEKVLPSLRLLDGGEREEMSRLAAEGRLQVQDAVDNVLSRAEQAAKRAA